MICSSLKILCPVVFALAGVTIACSSDTFSGGDSDNPTRPEDTTSALAIIDNWDSSNKTIYDSTLDMPDDGCIKLIIRDQSLNLRKEFLDSNYLHYEVGEKLGIEPISGDAELWNISRPLLPIKSTPYYIVDDMSHAYPYLIPEARDLLNDIGRRFRDSLTARGGGDYRLHVTSMLRTSGTIRKLRRVNRASVDSSAHRFGTTFDISFTRFGWDGDDSQPRRTQEDLKNLLGEVLKTFRAENRCYIIFERKPGCFHITTRVSS